MSTETNNTNSVEKKAENKKEIDENNPFGLSVEERRVLHFWQNGYNMKDAYKKVMLSKYDLQAISDGALTMRVRRFFNTYRIREAMAATPGIRGEKARDDFEKWKQRHTEETVERFTGRDIYANCAEEEPKGIKKSTRAAWLESLSCVGGDPSSMTIYGTGQFIAYMAVKEIMDRQAEIKKRGLTALDKNGSVFTPTILNALKTAAAMVLPFAPAPTAEDRKEMSKAAVLLGLFPDDIKEDPDFYTAAPPVVDTTSEE